MCECVCVCVSVCVCVCVCVSLVTSGRGRLFDSASGRLAHSHVVDV